MKNLPIKVKLWLAAGPLIVMLMLSIIYFGMQMNTVAEESEELYYEKLYTINSTLTNADRDFYQSLVGATQYYDIVNGYSSVPPSIIDEKKAEKLADYEDNKQQVFDAVAQTKELVSDETHLYKGITAEDGKTFEELLNTFEEDLSQWNESFNVANNTGDWSAFNNSFTEARVALSEMEDITEEWAVQEKDGGVIPALSTLNAPSFPANLTTIEEEAFESTPFSAVIIPNTVTAIGSHGFANCRNLVYVYVPSSVTSIAADAFEGCTNVIIDRAGE